MWITLILRIEPVLEGGDVTVDMRYSKQTLRFNEIYLPNLYKILLWNLIEISNI